MKTKLFIFLLLNNILAFGQATLNQSIGGVQAGINNPIPAVGTEIFRFRSGLVTQLDAGTGFGFTADKWFSLGRFNAGSQTFYGQRFQLPNRALVMGYSTNNASGVVSNPLIQWIGTGTNLGNLEFRVANTFGAPNLPGADVLVATMTSFGNTVFGNLVGFATPSASSAKVGIASDNNNLFALDVKGGATAGINIDNSTTGAKINTTFTGVDIISKEKGIVMQVANGVNTFGVDLFSSGSTSSTGVKIFTKAGTTSIGVDSQAVSGSTSNIGVKGATPGTSAFEAGIYGQTPVGPSRYAGFFDGNVFTTGSYLPSDSKLKSNVSKELNVSDKLKMLNPVTYSYNKILEMNLPTEEQHGFISQEFATVFPELTKDITKPVFNDKGEITSNFTFKAINYNGLISVLTAGFKELSEEMVALKQELADYKASDVNRKSLINSTSIPTDYILEQNIPNPYSDKTSVRYKLPNGITKASIVVLDLNGKFVKEYEINQNNGEQIISATDIGKGIFLYSLIDNGSIVITKKMIIK